MPSEKKVACPDCGGTDLAHLHNEAHGLSGTHMVGSERFECECGKVVYSTEGIPLGFAFEIDGKETTT